MKNLLLILGVFILSINALYAQKDCRNVREWATGSSYNWDDLIKYKNVLYRAKQWNSNKQPDLNNSVWTEEGNCYDASYFESIDTISIYAKGKVIFKKELTVIDSIKHTLKTIDSLFVFRKNVAVAKFSFSELDSISFKKSNAKPTVLVGDEFGGGNIGYIFKPGDVGYVAGETHGLIVAPNDLEWYAETNLDWSVQGTKMPDSIPTSFAIGAGASNTQKIIDVQGGGVPGWPYSAMICKQVPTSGYGDWFIPSFYELKEILKNYKLLKDIRIDKFYSTSCHSHTDYHYQIGFTGYKVDCNWNGAQVRQVRIF